MTTQRFGRARPAGRLLAARSLIYLQAGILVLGAGWMFIVMITAGSVGSMTFPMQGLVDRTTVSGSAVAVLAVLNLLMAGGAVFLGREAESNPQGYRATLTALEIGIALYLVGFIGTAIGDVVFGPVLAVTVVGIHWWPELDARLLGSGGTWAAPALPPIGAGLEAADPAGGAPPPALTEGAVAASAPAPPSDTHAAVPAFAPPLGGDVHPAT